MVSLMIWYLMNCVCEKEMCFTCAGGESVKRGRERVVRPGELRILSVRVSPFTSPLLQLRRSSSFPSLWSESLWLVIDYYFVKPVLFLSGLRTFPIVFSSSYLLLICFIFIDFMFFFFLVNLGSWYSVGCRHGRFKRVHE